MKRLIAILLSFQLCCSCFAGQTVILAEISVDELPEAFFGIWRINAKLDSTNSYQTFKPQSADIWNLSRVGDKVTLTNPFTGASADVSVKTVEGNLIVFSKKAPYDNKVLTDTIAIRLDKNKFSGINTLMLETFSNADNSLIKSEQARYIINGEKISGNNVLTD